MKTIYSIHNSCLYPHPLLTTVNPHAHEDTHSRAGVERYSIFGILVSEGHDYPLPPTWAYRRGHTPYLTDFLRATKFHLFFRVHFGVFRTRFLIIARSVYSALLVVVLNGDVFESGNSALCLLPFR